MAKGDKSGLPCPDHVGGCKHPEKRSTDAYTLYGDKHGHCFSCGCSWFPEDFAKKPKDYGEPVFHEGFRGIKAAVCEILGIHSYCDEAGNVMFREYRTPTGSKFRDVVRKQNKMKGAFFIEGKYPKGLVGTNLFNAGSAHYVTVVEGEEDWAAAYQMLNYGKKTIQPVVALTSANFSKKEVYDYLSTFETVKLAVDNDGPGQEAAALLAEMLPSKVRKVSMTKHKDANAYLEAGDDKEWVQAWNNAAIMTVDNVYHTEEDFSSILADEMTESYFETSNNSLNEVIKGIPTNHITLITGQEGIGKTEILRSLECDALAIGKKIAVLHMEETKKTLLRNLAGFSMDKDVRDPDNPVENDKISKELYDLTDGYKNLFLFEFKSEPTVEMILEQFKYLVTVCDVEYIFIDPVNQFHPDKDESRVELLDMLAMKVEAFVQHYPVGVVWTAHLTDDGKTRNSRMIGKASSIRIDLQRDLEAVDEVDRNHTWIKVTKNRPFSTTGPAGTYYWDKKTSTICEGWFHQDWNKTEAKRGGKPVAGIDESQALGKPEKPLPF